MIIQQCKNKMCCTLGDVILLSLQNVRGDIEEIQSTCMFCSEYIVYCINKTNVEAANTGRSRHMVRFNCIEDSQKFLLRSSKLKLKIKLTPKNDINSLQISEFQNKDHFTKKKFTNQI